jgi:hypothetical protein
MIINQKSESRWKEAVVFMYFQRNFSDGLRKTVKDTFRIAGLLDEIRSSDHPITEQGVMFRVL